MICTKMFRSIRTPALLCLMAMGCWSCAASQPAQSTITGATTAKIQGPTSSYSPGDAKPLSSQCIIPYYPPPSSIDLCGEPVPLQQQEVLERFDKEFTLIVYNHAQIYLWLKRMERYFPWIEERLRANGLPDDLKYVAIVESDLLPDACSPKGAAGPWQFMPSTGSAYGLQQRGSCDERYDFERATECAFRYMNDLYRRYRNWTVAIATYNCGDKRIQEQMRSLGATDYYRMRLPNETERYIFRILAIKAVLGNPAQYGYHLPKGQGYPPLKAERVNVQLTCPLPMQSVAEASGTTLREIKRLNPAFRSEEIPEGSHQIKVPEGSANKFEKNIDYPAARSTLEESWPSGRAVVESPPDDVKPSKKAKNKQRAGKSVSASDAKSDSKNNKAKQGAPVRKAGAETVKKGEPLSTTSGQNSGSADELKRAKKLKSKNGSSGQKRVSP